jgi:hypothetical protein
VLVTVQPASATVAAPAVQPFDDGSRLLTEGLPNSKTRQTRNDNKGGSTIMSYVQRRRFLWILFLIGLAALAMSAAVTSATPLVRIPFEDLARQSTAVARLRCIGSQSHWDGRETWTETRFEVLELDKGLLSGLVSVRMVGGRAGHLHSRVEGVPSFRPGEEVYLFLWSQLGSEPYSVLGWSQGSFRIARNGDTGTESVTQDSATVSIFDSGKREFRRYGIRNLPVPLFKAKLWKALNSQN